MNRKNSCPPVDLLVIITANLFNLIMVIIFYLRTRDVNHPLGIGYLWTGLIILLATCGAINLKSKRDWWFSALPLLFAGFLIMELVLDYILQYDFRNSGLIIPYLILYYLSIMGMIGYAFLTEKKWGAVTLATYFISQIAAIYSYIQVGHG